MVRLFNAGEQPRHNWGLFVLLGLCLEFWIVVTTVVAENV
jgi:hypothetical protein